jgi:hypothetical protein
MQRSKRICRGVLLQEDCALDRMEASSFAFLLSLPAWKSRECQVGEAARMRVPAAVAMEELTAKRGTSKQGKFLTQFEHMIGAYDERR